MQSMKPEGLIKRRRRKILEGERSTIDQFVVHILRKVDLQEQSTMARQASVTQDGQRSLKAKGVR